VCTINDRSDGYVLSGSTAEMTRSGLTYESYGPGAYESTMHFEFEYTIRCGDGTEHSGEILVDRDYAVWTAEEGDDFENTDSLIEDVFSDAGDKLVAIIEVVCAGPAPPLMA
jgi:hypothetical protein